MPGLSDNVLEAPAVAAPAAAPAPAEPPSLRDTLEAAIKETPIEGAQPDRDTNTRTEGSDRQTQRVRDNTGKFTKRNADGSEVPTAEQVAKAQPDLDKTLSLDPNEQEDADEQGTGQQSKEDILPNTDNAPRSWKGPAKDKWATVDPVIRAEVHRRERDMARAAQDHAPVKQFTQQFTEVIKPFAQHYAQSKLPPLQLFNNLMSADVHLSTAPPAARAQFMAKLIKDYGIDISMLDSALAGEDIQASPSAAFERVLEERLAPVNEFLQSETQRRQATAQAERQRAETVLDRMARDQINFPHFDLVAQDMADITEMALKRRVYLTPQEAYARAVALNPEAQAAEQSRSGQQRAQQAHDAATRSLGASLSVSGTPAGLKQEVSPSDLRGTIEAAWADAQGR